MEESKIIIGVTAGIIIGYFLKEKLSKNNSDEKTSKIYLEDEVSTLKRKNSELHEEYDNLFNKYNEIKEKYNKSWNEALEATEKLEDTEKLLSDNNKLIIELQEELENLKIAYKTKEIELSELKNKS